jgi:site-specific DNA-methyltransferase (adenine-specific)
MYPIFPDLVPGRIMLRQSDCLPYLRLLRSASVDAIVTDPPYGLSENPPPVADVLAAWLAGEEYVHKGKGFMEREWDAYVPGPAIWMECLRVLKPGGHLLAFSGARTSHLLAIAVDLAGFEIRNSIAWIHTQGGGAYTHDIAQRFEKLIATGRSSAAPTDQGGKSHDRFGSTAPTPWIKNKAGKIALTHAEAQDWEGYGTGLKPAHEPILVARKPMIGSYVANLRMHGVGALNIAACSVNDGATNRHPSNVIHDGSPEVLAGFPGNKAGFFFCPKPNAAERAGNTHLTMKPIALMQYLLKMVTRENSIVIDPYAGSGTTGLAMRDLDLRGVLIEREPAYCEGILQRFSTPPMSRDRIADVSISKQRKPKAVKAVAKPKQKKSPAQAFFEEMVADGQTDLIGYSEEGAKEALDAA